MLKTFLIFIIRRRTSAFVNLPIQEIYSTLRYILILKNSTLLAEARRPLSPNHRATNQHQHVIGIIVRNWCDPSYEPGYQRPNSRGEDLGQSPEGPYHHHIITLLYSAASKRKMIFRFSKKYLTTLPK